MPPKIILSLLIMLSTFYTSVPLKAANIESEGFVPVAGASLYYKVIGEGKPLLVLHGGPGLDHSYFLPQMEVLAKNYKLIFFDQRGCGRSTDKIDSASISMAQFVDDIEALRKYFELDKVNLLGHSFGALLAMRYAIKYPTQVNSLMLVNPSAASSIWRDSSFSSMKMKKDPETIEKMNLLMKTLAFENREPGAMSDFYRLTFRSSFYDPSKVDELSLNFQKNYVETARLMNQLQSDSTLISYDLHPDLKKLNIHALIIGGEADVIHPMALEELHSSLKGSQYSFIEGCGHFPFIEQPEQFLKAINKFFSKF